MPTSLHPDPVRATNFLLFELIGLIIADVQSCKVRTPLIPCFTARVDPNLSVVLNDAFYVMWTASP